MSKKPIAVLITDTHLSNNNIEHVSGIFDQVAEYCEKHSIKDIYHLGDFFQSRTGQPLPTLKATQNIIQKIKGFNVNIIAGNHDKQNLDSEDSYLDVFHNDEYFNVIREYESIVNEDIIFWFLPYFKETGEKYKGYLKEIINKVKKNSQQKHILLTHIGVNGVLNNDDIETENGISKDMFKVFDKICIGHFHNICKVGENIFYIGSVSARNYGEDNNKGLTVLYEDGSHEQVILDFPKYMQFDYDPDNVTKKEIDILGGQKKQGHNVRVTLRGSEAKVKSFNKAVLSDIGVDVKIKEDSIEQNKENAKKGIYEAFTNNSIKEEFKVFCRDKKLNHKQGCIYLENTL